MSINSQYKPYLSNKIFKNPKYKIYFHRRFMGKSKIYNKINCKIFKNERNKIY